MWQGPTNSGLQSDLLNGEREWFGLEPGTDLTSLGMTQGTNQLRVGPTVGVPAPWAVDYMRNWVRRDQTWTWSDETSLQYFQDVNTSTSLYSYALDVTSQDC